MEQELPIDVLRRQIEERLASAEVKRMKFTKRLNILKFLRVLCGVLSVGLVSAIGAGGFEGTFEVALSMAAVIATTITTFSSELIDAFGYEERMKQNIKSVSSLKSLRSRLDLDISIRSSAESNIEVDYWSYYQSLTGVLASQNDSWHKAINNSKK